MTHLYPTNYFEVSLAGLNHARLSVGGWLGLRDFGTSDWDGKNAKKYLDDH